MNKNLLIIGYTWPEPNSTAAGTRMIQLIQLFQEKGYKITLVSAASKTVNSYDLEELGIDIFEIEVNNSNFDSLIIKIDPTIVLFDRFYTEEQFGWRIAENCPNALRILDTEDLHFLRFARKEALKNNDSIGLNYLVNDIAKRELASIYRCDLTLIISKFEYNLLLETFKLDQSLLLYIPFLLEPINSSKFSLYPDFNERDHYMTIGNFRHEPNWSALLYLKNYIWPLIREELPKAKIHVYGAYVTEKVMQLQNKKEGFIINGWADSSERAFKNARVCLAPLQFGAGLKGKLIDAMLFGTPSVTTKIGAEAMHDNKPWNGYISDDHRDFARKSVELYNNKQTWLRAQNNGISIINQCYSKKDFGQTFFDCIQKIETNLDEHRLDNITGAILMHHTLQSTKYLSKWIEAKNK
jgi:glycosyltransferase involved in cell wall biosynthesis